MKKIGIIAPAGAVENIQQDKIKSFFEKFEIEAVIFPSCYKKFRYMAGSDEERLCDLHLAFCDKTIDWIICARGGYGAIRILDKIDYKLISLNKKPFIGFSDATALLIAMYKNAGLCSFHGKMAVNGVCNMSDDEFKIYCSKIKNSEFKTDLRGGILWGGNLATIVSLFGSNPASYIPDENIILFLEDINEPDYKIDRMLNQILRNKFLTKKIRGVIFGEFQNAGNYLQEIKQEFIQNLNVPYENNLNITHGLLNTVVPFGKML